MEKSDSGVGGVYLIKLFSKSIILAMCLTLIMIFILSFLVSTTELRENIINPTVIFISALSILIGSFSASKKIKKRGIIIGAIVGITYMVIMYLISSIINMNFSITINSLIMIVFGILGGTIGGILGVNIGK